MSRVKHGYLVMRGDKFYQSPGKWTDEYPEAFIFASRTEARRICMGHDGHRVAVDDAAGTYPTAWTWTDE